MRHPGPTTNSKGCTETRPTGQAAGLNALTATNNIQSETRLGIDLTGRQINRHMSKNTNIQTIIVPNATSPPDYGQPRTDRPRVR